MRRWLGFLSLLLLAGCVTPADAPRYARAPSPSSGFANVYFYRAGAMPALRTVSIRVDGHEILDAPNHSYTVVQVPAGSHAFDVRWPIDTIMPSLNFLMNVEAGESIYVRVDGGIAIAASTYNTATSAHRISPSDAESELSQCCRYMAPKQ